MNEIGNIDRSRIFTTDQQNFEAMAVSVFEFQYLNNDVYRQFCDLIHSTPATVRELKDIPFLPIGFFKTRGIKSTPFEPELIFESSRTTGDSPSRHYVKQAGLYKESFQKTFELFYGDVRDYCIIGLLPSYLERENSSLVYMVNDLVKRSANVNSGFYLHNFEQLHETLRNNEEKAQPTLLFGVTFALLDFASEYPLPLSHTTIIETGGMKGRKREQTREEVHLELQAHFKTSRIHSEYGMTELLSQAYATGTGMFDSPPWMRILIREADDPFTVTSYENLTKSKTGLGNIVDLANLYSCSFIATDDVVKLHPEGSFEVLGRADNSDIRGCSLMVNVV